MGKTISAGEVVAGTSVLGEIKMSSNERGLKCNAQGGFTLIELLVVIAIVALLAAMMIPRPITRSKFIHSIDTLHHLNFGRGVFWLSEKVGECGLINLRELPLKGLLAWSHLQHLMFQTIDRENSQWAFCMGASRLAQEQGVGIWCHEIIKRIIQIRLANF